jgi:hypothetical protein
MGRNSEIIGKENLQSLQMGSFLYKYYELNRWEIIAVKWARLISIVGGSYEPYEWRMDCFKPEADWRVAVCMRTVKEIKVILTKVEGTDLGSIEPF